jgi:hypothetical protein
VYVGLPKLVNEFKEKKEKKSRIPMKKFCLNSRNKFSQKHSKNTYQKVKTIKRPKKKHKNHTNLIFLELKIY